MGSINKPNCFTEYSRLIPINHEVELEEIIKVSHVLLQNIEILSSFSVIKDKK